MRNSRSDTDVAMVAANSTCSGVPPNCGAMNLDVNVASRRHLQRLTNAHTIQVLHNRNPGLLSGDKFRRARRTLGIWRYHLSLHGELRWHDLYSLRVRR